MIGRVGGRGYRDLEVRKTAETDEEGAAEAHRKIGTVGPDDEMTATGVDTTGHGEGSINANPWIGLSGSPVEQLLDAKTS